jgi:hypothetical protein
MTSIDEADRRAVASGRIRFISDNGYMRGSGRHVAVNAGLRNRAATGTLRGQRVAQAARAELQGAFG